MVLSFGRDAAVGGGSAFKGVCWRAGISTGMGFSVDERDTAFSV